MKQDYLEPGAIYFAPGDTQDCLSIIQDGQIDMTTELDTGTTMVIEKLTRGAVIGAHKMLVSDLNSVTAICVSHVIIYTIDRKLFTQLCTMDVQLMRKLIRLQDELLDKQTEERTLDFIQIKRQIKLPTGKKIFGEEAMRASALSLELKNVILL